MPATTTLYAATVAATTGTPAWTTTANATGSTTGTYAGWAPTTNGAVGYIQLSGYGAQAAVSSGSTVDSVQVAVRFHVTTATGRWTSVTAQLFDGASTAIGAAQTLTLSTTTTNEQTLTFTGVTWAQLANLNVRITGTKSGTQASTLNVDRAGLVVNYTAPPSPPPTDTYGALIFGAGPSAYYRLDGTTADFMGGPSGVVHSSGYGTSVIAPYTGGQAATFDGSTAYIDVPASAAITPTTAMSVESWIRIAGVGATGDGYTVPLGKATWGFQFQQSTMLPQFFIGTVATGAGGAPPMSTGGVYHIVGTWDGTTARCYLNGSEVGTVAWSAALADTSNLFIGAYNNSGSPFDLFNGSIDEVAVYKRALSATEVADHYAAGAGAPALTVRAARSATRASRPLLTQSTALVVKAARAVTRASRPKLTQQQPTLTIRSARSATRAGRPLLTQAQTITVRAARSATRAGRPLLSQAVGSLVVRGARSVTRVTRPLLTQAQGVLVVRSARSATRAGRPLLTQQQPALIVKAARSVTRAGRALLVQHSPLAAAGARAETRATDVRLALAGEIAVRDARAQTRTGAALLTHQQTVTVNGVRSATRASAPALAQDTALAVHGARVDTRAQAVTLPPPAGTLAVRAARADTRASAPALEQLQLLTVAGARAPTRADRARLSGTSTPAAPPERTLTVAADNRTTPVARDDRTTTVAPDSRTHHVAADDRTLTVPAETRTHLVP